MASAVGYPVRCARARLGLFSPGPALAGIMAQCVRPVSPIASSGKDEQATPKSRVGQQCTRGSGFRTRRAGVFRKGGNRSVTQLSGRTWLEEQKEPLLRSGHRKREDARRV